MLVYFLGGEGGFAESVRARKEGRGADLRFFPKIGLFAQAVKSKSPELIFADKDFLPDGFDLRSFLSEQKISAPIFFFTGRGRTDGGQDFLYRIKSRCKISRRLFELLKCLYDSERAQSIEEIRTRLLESGTNVSAGGARVSISRLKKRLKAQDEFDIDLAKEADGYRLRVFKKEKAPPFER